MRRSIIQIFIYDKALSVIQSLLIFGNQHPYDGPPPLPDGTKANGDWSIRELSSILSNTLQPFSDSVIVDGVALSPGALSASLSGNALPGISVRALIVALSTIANGNWDGPAKQVSLAGGASFQDRLSLAAGFIEVG
jgi:hypothetical protein